MAQQARQALTVAPRYQMPPGFSGTEVAWRSLCDTYPSAETPEVLMALMEYCAVRKLDPFKRPVHIVPMYNSRLRRKVQVVMQGINEVEITASRTGQWAGMDAPEYGPPVDRVFRGEFESDDGTVKHSEVTLRYPAWCRLTVYRMVGGQRAPFTEMLFWDECYGRAGFRSEMPNARWQQAPRQMLHKCVKAAVLRAAFPEEGFGYTQEEMEDHETDAGGVVIDGKAERPPPSQEQIARDRQADESYPPRLQALEEPNGTVWFQNLLVLLKGATSASDVAEIAGHSSVHKVLAVGSNTPSTIRANITDALRQAHDRFMQPPASDEADTTTQQQPTWDGDPIAALLEEVAGMDLITITGLPSNAQWSAKVRDAASFPPDEDRITEAVEARKLALQSGKGKA